MKSTLHIGIAAFVLVATAISAAGQSSWSAATDSQSQVELSPSAPIPSSVASSPDSSLSVSTVQQLLDFRDADVKFDLRDLMEVLKDRRHEGWVLAAYPDPKTSRPLIGAGFTLDLPAREHPQRDPLNTHPFIEPSSAQLWQTAGLNSERLQRLLEQYDTNLAAWTKNRYRKNIPTLTPQITQEEATLLLRVSAIQAIYNAKAYCRNFDRYNASQQMGLTQLVYQMGVNLEEFSQFLNLINSDALPHLSNAPGADHEYWKAVQGSLIQSQWARLYRVRATSVIAMLDPQYSRAPAVAERHVGATLRPAVSRHRKGRPVASLRSASYRGHTPAGARKKKSRVRGK